MSVTTSQPPIPRQSIGATFVVSMVVLGFVAAVQVVAVILHYKPMVQQQVRDMANAQPTPQATPAPMAQAPVQPAAPQDAQRQQISQILDQAFLKFRLGDFDNALKMLAQVEAISPNDPKVLWGKALVLEKMDRQAEAVLQLEAFLRIPGVPAPDREVASKKLEQLSEALGGGPSTAPKGNTADLYQNQGQPLTDTQGIRAGATLGIVDIRPKDIKKGYKNLNVSVKSLPQADIVGDKVKILAYFYEKTEEGEITLTESKIVPQWMSPPIDWAENEPEILDLQYTLPEAGRNYVGYVVGLYYNGELQDYRSDPVQLIKEFPLPLDDPQ